MQPATPTLQCKVQRRRVSVADLLHLIHVMFLLLVYEVADSKAYFQKHEHRTQEFKEEFERTNSLTAVYAVHTCGFV